MKITSISKLTNELWVNLFAATYETTGHSGRWVFASRRRGETTAASGDAVVMVPILRNPGEPPRLVLIHEFRVPVGGFVYGLPAGLIEDGEAIEEAIRREMLEETGFEVARLTRLSQPLLSSSGLTDESAAMAFLDVVGQPGAAQALEATELIEVVLADHAEVCRLVADTSLRMDAKLWHVLLMYSQLGLG